MALNGPVILHQALSSFDDVYSPRIVATMNDYDGRIAHTLGDYVWHRHENTDEFSSSSPSASTSHAAMPTVPSA